MDNYIDTKNERHPLFIDCVLEVLPVARGWGMQPRRNKRGTRGSRTKALSW